MPAVTVRAEDHTAVVWRMARMMAARYGSWHELDDMVGDGMEALVRAVRTFDGLSDFDGYAAVRIRWRIIDRYRLRHGKIGSRRRRLSAVTADDDRHPAAFFVEPLAPSAEDEVLGVLCAAEAVAALPSRLRAVAEASLVPGGQLALAREWGVSESRICQLRRQAHRLLRRHYAQAEAS